MSGKKIAICVKEVRMYSEDDYRADRKDEWIIHESIHDGDAYEK